MYCIGFIGQVVLTFGKRNDIYDSSVFAFDLLLSFFYFLAVVSAFASLVVLYCSKLANHCHRFCSLAIVIHAQQKCDAKLWEDESTGRSIKCVRSISCNDHVVGGLSLLHDPRTSCLGYLQAS